MIDIKRKLEKLECQVNPPQTWQGLLAALSDQELDDFILLSEAQCILSGATTADIEAVYIEATSAYDARLRTIKHILK